MAKQYVDDVEFSAEDATRSDWDFLVGYSGGHRSGRNDDQHPDTVGYTTPDEYARLIAYIRENTPGIEKAVISVHCHDDLGLAVANSLARCGRRDPGGVHHQRPGRAGRQRRLRRDRDGPAGAPGSIRSTPASSPSTFIGPVVWSAR